MCGPYLWGPRSSTVTGPSGKGTGVAEMVKVELTSEVSCWPFPCPGLPHHRCLPDPTESQGTPRLKVAWQQEAQVGERSHHWSLRPGFWDMKKSVGSQPEGKLQDWSALGLLTWHCPPRPLPLGAHCAMLLPDHRALAPSLLFNPGTLSPGC